MQKYDTKKKDKQTLNVLQHDYLKVDEIFDSNMFKLLIEDLRIKRRGHLSVQFLEREICGVSTGKFNRYMAGTQYPNCKTYKSLYEYFAQLPEYQDEQIDEYYLCKIEKSKIDLLELIFIRGFSTKSIYDELKARGIKKNTLNNFFYDNSGIAIVDMDRADRYIKLIHARTKIKCDLLRKSFEKACKDQSIFWGREAIEDMVLERLKKAFREYIERHPNLNTKKLAEMINASADIDDRISHKTIDPLCEKDDYKLTPGKVRLLTRFLNPNLEGDQLMLVYTTYESIEELTMYELIYLNGYGMGDIVSSKNRKEQSLFAKFLFRGVDCSMKLEERFKICDEIRVLLGIEEGDKHIIDNAYFNTTQKHLNFRANRQNAVRDNKLKRKEVFSEGSSIQSQRAVKVGKKRLIDSRTSKRKGIMYTSSDSASSFDSTGGEDDYLWATDHDSCSTDIIHSATSSLNDDANFSVDKNLLINMDNIQRKPRSVRVDEHNPRLTRGWKANGLKKWNWR